MKALSLFSGCGGLDIGVEATGFENVASIECDKNAVQTLKQWRDVNHKSNEIFGGDIRAIDPTIFKKHKIDLLHGGPPCQAFSLIGKRNSLGDPRGQLLFEVIRFAAVLRPRAVMVENVKGLLSAPDENGKSGGAFEAFIKELSKLNYVPKWAVVNAADYGIPQKRERVFIKAMTLLIAEKTAFAPLRIMFVMAEETATKHFLHREMLSKTACKATSQKS